MVLICFDVFLINLLIKLNHLRHLSKRSSVEVLMSNRSESAGNGLSRDAMSSNFLFVLCLLFLLKEKYSSYVCRS